MAKVWETERLVIRESAAVTAREIADFHRRNREFMKVYAPAREDAYYTEAFWQQELRDELAEEADGRSCRFYLYRKTEPGVLCGYVALSNIVRRAFQSCFIGYQMDERWVDQGYMTEAVARVARIAFQELRLHRIEANIMPWNKRSLRVAEKCGFVGEGVSPISSIPYAMTCIWGIEMGKATIILHCALVLLQILLLRKRFKPVNLLQVVVGIVFGYFTTFCNWCVSFLPDTDSMVLRVVLLLLSVVCIALGIFLYMPPDIMALAGEGTIKAISDVSGMAFAKVKVLFDSSLVAISLAACLLCIGSFGSVGVRTVIAAVLVGTVLGFLTKWFAPQRDRWLFRENTRTL